MLSTISAQLGRCWEPMSNAMYVCYMALLAVFGWLCYRFGFVAGRIEELVNIVDFIIHDQSPEDPAPEEVE